MASINFNGDGFTRDTTMRRLLYISAFALGLFVAAAPNQAGAQSVSIGRGGVHYNPYGRGNYGGGYGHGYGGGYGHGYGGGYAPRVRVYSGYGYGPYGYGSNGGYGYGNGAYYNGYGNSGYYVQPQRPVYRPYGFGINNNNNYGYGYGYGW